ncbi:variable large family protein (plasmid) [Borrelia parkeri]|uniref:variable large family protein n=1 Tax=Borrelia parkeri TaxID=141 RepID=UPI001FF50C78|nr:variable large family protein [Borrelia parkeri]UPA11706.1 variable large family protein [Borrelia parkeri]
MMKRITFCALLMTLFLLLGCGSGSAKVEDPKTTFLTSIANLGKGFLDVFTSLSDMVSGAFGIKAETKKSDIGKYFSDIETTMISVKNKLNTVMAENSNYPKVKEVVAQFITGTLDKIAAGAKEASKGATTDTVIGNAVKDTDAAPANKDAVNTLVKGMKTMVDIVLKDNEGNADATKTSGEKNKVVGKLFGGKANAEEAQAAAASSSIGAVTGADILKAIAKSGEAANNEIEIDQAKNAAEIAAAKKDDNKDFGAAAQKDAVIAAGIALRAMAKDGKFAANNDDKYANAVNGVAANAVGKTLSTLIIAIRKTVDTGLKTISEALATVKQEDKSADSTTPAETATSGQQ